MASRVNRNSGSAFVVASVLTGALLLGACTGCSRSSPGKPALPAAASPKPSVISVKVDKPRRETLHHTIAQPGAIQALEQPAIYAKVAGYLAEWKVDMGDRIRKGDLLAELAVPELAVDLGQKDALVRQAEAQLKMAKEAVPAAEAEQRRARSQYERLAKVGQTGVLDKDNIAEALYGSEASKARLAIARADVAVKEAQLDVARKNREYSETMLKYMRIVAPFDGVVTRRYVDTGQFVQPATGTKGDILFTVARTDIMRIFVEVPETEAYWVTDGMPAQVRVQALGGQQFTGKVTRTSWSLDRTSRTLLAAIDFPNNLEGKFRPGMYAYAVITGERSGVLTVPASAVVTQGDLLQGYQTFCFVEQDGKARRTLLQVGGRDAQRIEVLKKQTTPASKGTPRWEDLTGDEKIILGDVAALSDGQAVQVGGAK
jgi:HlyD family secretion protein